MIWLLIGYMWLFIHRPFEIWPILATIQIERLYVLVAIVATICTTRGIIHSSLNRAWLIFAGAVLICWLASPWRDTAIAGLLVSNWFKILVFYFLVILNVRTERDLELLVTGFVGVISLFMLHSIWEFHHGRRTFRMGIARMNGINVLFAHPNNFSATLVFALPFYGLVYRIATTKWLRYACVGGVLAVLYCVVNTGSRTALVGVAAIAGLAAFRSPYRWRIALAATVLLPIAWNFVPEDKQGRFLTILGDSYYTEQPHGAQTSAETRTEGFYEGWKLFQEHPLTGVGPGGWIPATGWNIESHNLYGQLPGEMGLVGLFTFGLVLGAYWTNLRELRWLVQSTRYPSQLLLQLGTAIQDATILLLFLGVAGHNLFRFNWIWHAAFLAIAVEVAREQYLESAEDELDDEAELDDEWDDPDGEFPREEFWDDGFDDEYHDDEYHDDENNERDDSCTREFVDAEPNDQDLPRVIRSLPDSQHPGEEDPRR